MSTVREAMRRSVSPGRRCQESGFGTPPARYLFGVHLRRSLVACGLSAAVGAATLAAGAGATVPPKNCGPLTVGSRTYTIKADQIRCSTAKASARTYLTSRRVPRGFTCRNFTGSKMTFRCSKKVQVFFAIRR